MKFTAYKSSQEAAAAAAASIIAPAGDHAFVVVAADTDAKSKTSGKAMIALGLSLTTPVGERKISDWIIETQAEKLRCLCESLGILDVYNTGEIAKSDLLGARGVVRVSLEPDKKKPGTMRNNVVTYVAAPVAEEQPTESAPF
jgi:hypothetical protein